MKGYEMVIGLEVHVQLNSTTKAFARERNAFSNDPNQHISEICLGYPGTLPMVNRSHILSAVKLGLALNCEINTSSFFDRKSYFYPDLTKGYQITQDRSPICIGGVIDFYVNENKNQISLHHIHCEEDAGKTIHDIHDKKSMLDYNRAGTPLLEIVTNPDFRSGEEVYAFMSYMQKLVRYLNISDGNMEQGSLRCDCNLSVRPVGSSKLGTRAEIKNMNSKKFALDAINYEAQRQIDIIESGGQIVQETRLYNPSLKKTFSMREKETAVDYRYFPDPDLLVVELQPELIENIKSSIQITPFEAEKHLRESLQLSSIDAQFIAEDINRYSYFKTLIDSNISIKAAKNLITLYIIPYCQSKSIDIFSFPIEISDLKIFISKIEDGELTKDGAFKIVWPIWLKNPSKSLDEIIAQQELTSSNDSEAENLMVDIINKVVDLHLDKIKPYQNGKKQLINVFLGEAMKLSKGQLNAQKLRQQLANTLDNYKL